MIGPPEEMAATVQRVFVCFAEFLFVLQRGAAAAVRKNSHGRGVLGGYSGGTREYYWVTTRVLLGYYWGTTGEVWGTTGELGVLDGYSTGT